MNRRAVVMLGMLLGLAATAAHAEDAAPDRKSYRGGNVRLGWFIITNIQTQLRVDSQRFPIGTSIDLSQDLGLKDASSQPRAVLSYRFSRRHRFDAGFYRINRSGTRVLDRTIEIGDEVFPIGTEVDTQFQTSTLKAQYTWIFHDDPKVTLGLSAGLHFTGLDFGIRSTGDIAELEESGKFPLPLPVLGGRLGYHVTPKLSVLAQADFFFLNYGDYRGRLVDAGLLVEHHTFRHVGFGGGLNLLSLNAEIEEEETRLWDIEHLFTGYMAYVAFYFD